ncbi:hypothetical protein, partial [Bradyrhizobium sp.]
MSYPVNSVIIIGAAIGWASLAHAEDKPPAKPLVTMGQIQQLDTALRNLDGRIVIVKQNGVDNLVMQPWEFSDGKFRLRLSNNINIADAAMKLLNETQQKIFQENLKKAQARVDQANEKAGKPSEKLTELNIGMPERDDFDHQTVD